MAKVKYRFLLSHNMEKPQYKYENKGPGSYRYSDYFDDFETVEEAEKELDESDFDPSDYEQELVLVRVYN